MKKKMNVVTWTIASISLFAIGCTAPEPAPAPVDMAAITATIQGMEDAYAAASAKKDAAAVVEYYSDDAVSYGKEMPAMVGKEAIRQHLAERMAKDSSGATPSFKVVEIFMGTDQLTEIGTWTDTDATGAVKDQGTYFSVFKKNGDKWQCTRDISVSHMPKPEAAPAVVAVP